ncbi:hypothetical protein BGZ61DRAFT_39494 [Ilyonectria robusta]|uniref:uncharacterized protein n=1 Tax=Ilyonectria robusta TaxID=1079257 RepID=UPI001E8E65CA|nr:uncharacterized protein BGZ61DRAFT_39494 [Ilyonectria robusta]KAH8688158.1 hypothetical protein BGZ61DRAFT_39494 [Ilyonectria robusta]
MNRHLSRSILSIGKMPGLKPRRGRQAKVCKGGAGSGQRYSLGGDSLVLDATVDERGQLVGRLLDGGGFLGHGELLEELVQDLDALSVLGRHLGGCLDFFFFWRGIRKRKSDRREAHRDRWRGRLCCYRRGDDMVILWRRGRVRSVEIIQGTKRASVEEKGSSGGGRP